MKFLIPEDADEKTKRKLGNLLNGNTFSKDNQPNEAKRRGWAKKIRNQELIRAFLDLTYVGPRDEMLRDTLAKFFGIENNDDITNEMMIVGTRIAAAIQKNDLASAQWLYDRAFGKAKEHVEISTEEQRTLVLQPVVMYGAPEIKTTENDTEISTTNGLGEADVPPGQPSAESPQ